MSVVDDYLKNTEPPYREVLERIRTIVRETAPGAEEVMSYGMPGFKYKKKYLATFGVFKDHMSFFPGPEAIASVQDKIPDQVTSKGTIQFTLEKPLSDEIVRKIILHRVHAIDHKA